jgi:hypothetical protein
MGLVFGVCKTNRNRSVTALRIILPAKVGVAAMKASVHLGSCA